MFAEDLSPFFDVSSGFAVNAKYDNAYTIPGIFDERPVDILQGEGGVTSSRPTLLVKKLDIELNLLKYSEDFTGWLNYGGSTGVAVDYRTLEDDNPGYIEGITNVSVPIVDNEVLTLSVEIKNDTTPKATRFCELNILMEGGSVIQNQLRIDTDTAETLATGSGDFNILDSGKSTAGVTAGHVRYWITAQNDTSGNYYANALISPAKGAGADLSVPTVSATGTILATKAQLRRTATVGNYQKTTNAPGIEAAYDKPIIVNGTTYTIKDVEPDGTGLVLLELEKV